MYMFRPDAEFVPLRNGTPVTYSGFTFRSNIPYAVQRKLILCAYIHLYLKTRHKLPVYGIRNIRTERKSAVTGCPVAERSNYAT